MTYSTQVVPVLGHECSISQSIKNIQKFVCSNDDSYYVICAHQLHIDVWELTLADARSCLTHPYVPIIVAVATRTCLIASDTIVLLVTWINVYKLKTVVGQGNTDLLSLLSSLLRDGTEQHVKPDDYNFHDSI